MPPAPPTRKELVLIGTALLSAAFAGLVAADHAGFISWLDAEYRADGFCVAEHTAHGFNSYELCFFVDAVVCACFLSKRARPLRAHAPSLLLHGAFHYLQYLAGWPLPRALHLLAYSIFTLSFMYEFGLGFVVGSKAALALTSLAVVGTEFLLVPPHMGFAYTNFWIFALALSTGFARKRKGPDYVDSFASSWPAVLMLFWASGVFPFCEAALCNSGVKALGGHAIFDSSMAAVALISIAAQDAKPKSA